MTVPFSELVARRVPEDDKERNESGALCAWITFATVNERVEKRRTSPDWLADVDGDDVALEGVGCDDEVEPGGCVESGDVGEGTGDG